MSAPCYDCPRACGVDREKKLGFCGVGYNARVAKIVDPFDYEEPCLGTVRAVFFGGCTLKCSYCQNYKISRGGAGEEYSDEALAEVFDGAGKPIDLVTPTHVLSAVERAVSRCTRAPRFIYNTSGYETADAVARAGEFSSVFLTDLKYVGGDIAKRFSAAPDYFEKASAAIVKMRAKKDVFEDGVLTGGLIVRHLVLPGCAKDSMRVLDFIKAELGENTIISLMSQFTPNGVGEPKEKLKKIEYKLVAEHALSLGFKNGYFQGFDSADPSFTPDF